MRGTAFENWAAKHGNLKAESARSYVSYLASVEKDYGVNLDTDWNATRLARIRSLLSADRTLNANTQRNRLSALSKYEDFCSSTSG